MPPIGSNTNPTGLGTVDDYVERNRVRMSDFAGKTLAAKRVFNVFVRRTYNPLRGIPRNGFGRGGTGTGLLAPRQYPYLATFRLLLAFAQRWTGKQP